MLRVKRSFSLYFAGMPRPEGRDEWFLLSSPPWMGGDKGEGGKNRYHPHLNPPPSRGRKEFGGRKRCPVRELLTVDA
jgi:hypothetical protein